MKYFNSKASILILVLLSFFTSNIYCQEPLKKDSKIKVVPLDSSDLFNKLGLTLFERGYTFDTKDEKLKIIVTKAKSTSNCLIKVRAIIKDSIIVLTGEMAINIPEFRDSYSPIEFGGMKGSAARISWDELNAIAKLLGTKVYYSK